MRMLPVKVTEPEPGKSAVVLLSETLSRTMTLAVSRMVMRRMSPVTFWTRIDGLVAVE